MSGPIVPLLLIALALGAADQLRHARAEDDRQRLRAQMASQDWQVRSDAFDAAKALGWEGRDLVLQALSDRAEVISSRAQKWFLDQGEPAVRYLAEVLAQRDGDEGLYASIVDGRERNIGRSVSGTLWTTLARGIPRDRAAGLMNELLEHRSPRVRAVAVFAAGTLRDSAVMGIVAAGGRDDSPVVRRRFREALVRLLSFEWYTTPELDEATAARALDLLEPELPAILEDDTPAVFMGGLGSFVVGNAIGTAPLRHHRDRLVAMLEAAVPRLSTAAAARAGAIIERQAWIPADRGLAPNGLWDAKSVRDADLLARVSKRFLDEANASRHLRVRLANWAALSALPADQLDEEIAKAFFESELVRTETATLLAIRRLASAGASPDGHGFQEALKVVQRDLRDPDRALATAVLLYDGLVSSFAGESSTELQQSIHRAVAPEADRLYELARQAAPASQCPVLGLLIFAGNDGYFALFEEAWKHRPDPSLAACVNLVSRRGDRRVIPYLVDYIEANEYQDDLKSAAADALLRVPFTTEGGVLDAHIERLTGVAADPEVHPRTRATLAKLVELPHLTGTQRQAIIGVVLRNTQAPNEFNLRSKSCRSLGNAGVTEAKAPCMALTLLPDAPYWVAANAVTGLYALAQKRGDGADEVISILAASQMLYPERDPGIRLLQPANYYHWGVMYRVHPAFAVLIGLRAATGKDFGLDVDAWRAAQREGSRTEGRAK